jgi:hypothetical protein
MTAKRPRDVNELAKQVVDEAVGEAETTPKPKPPSPEASKRGKARAETLDPERRSEIARKAARARWHGAG